MLTSARNKSKMSWNIIYNEICAVSNKTFTQTEFKLRNKNISMKQSATISNNY
jgi:thiamine pyrophosphokinase